jgi:hypothetical protein
VQAASEGSWRLCGGEVGRMALNKLGRGFRVQTDPAAAAAAAAGGRLSLAKISRRRRRKMSSLSSSLHSEPTLQPQWLYVV